MVPRLVVAVFTSAGAFGCSVVDEANVVVTACVAGTAVVAAPLGVGYTANLGTLLRTCDAVGACIAVPATQHYRREQPRCGGSGKPRALPVGRVWLAASLHKTTV